VDAVLAEIGAGEIPQLLVFNKIDQAEGATPRADVVGPGPAGEGSRERLWLSARSGAGLDLLRAALSQRFVQARVQGTVHLDPAQGRLRSRLHALGAVRDEQVDEQGWTLELDLPLAAAERLADEAGGHLLQPLLLVTPSAPTYNS
jgi:GTP-binding protein HflX